VYTNLISGSDFVQWKETTNHDVTAHDDRLSGGTSRADFVRVDETGSERRHVDDVTVTAGACAEYDD